MIGKEIERLVRRFGNNMWKSFLKIILVSIILSSCDADAPLPKVYPGWTYYNSENSGLPNNNIHCISIDKDNTKWMVVRGYFGLWVPLISEYGCHSKRRCNDSTLI